MGTTDFAKNYLAKGDGKVYQGYTWYARVRNPKNHACIYDGLSPTLCGVKAESLGVSEEWTPDIGNACLSCVRNYNKITAQEG